MSPEALVGSIVKLNQIKRGRGIGVMLRIAVILSELGDLDFAQIKLKSVYRTWTKLCTCRNFEVYGDF